LIKLTLLGHDDGPRVVGWRRFAVREKRRALLLQTASRLDGK
jgi:hypothetical protein